MLIRPSLLMTAPVFMLRSPLVQFVGLAGATLLLNVRWLRVFVVPASCSESVTVVVVATLGALCVPPVQLKLVAVRFPEPPRVPPERLTLASVVAVFRFSAPLLMYVVAGLNVPSTFTIPPATWIAPPPAVEPAGRL